MIFHDGRCLTEQPKQRNHHPPAERQNVSGGRGGVPMVLGGFGTAMWLHVVALQVAVSLGLPLPVAAPAPATPFLHPCV